MVEVVDVTCDSLEAEVEIITGAPELEGKLATVPVDELYPLKDQEIPSLNMTPTVVALDLIRFFYKVQFFLVIIINFNLKCSEPLDALGRGQRLLRLGV